MAYAVTVTHSLRPPIVRGGQKQQLVVTIVETGAKDDDETTLTDTTTGAKVPLRGAFRRQSCALTVGTGTTIDPVLGEVTDPASRIDKIIAQNETAAAEVNNVALVPFKLATRDLFHRSVPDNVAADHGITTEYIFDVEEQ